MAETRRPPLPRLLSPREIEERTGLRRKTLYDWIGRGLLPAVRFGTAVRVDEDDLRRFIDRHRESVVA